VAVAVAVLRADGNATITHQSPADDVTAAALEARNMSVAWEGEASTAVMAALDSMKEKAGTFNWLLIITAGDEILLGYDLLLQLEASTAAVGYCPTDRQKMQATVRAAYGV
jgi:hypothetical protein